MFNSLNTIYSEALNKSGKAPELILKLSYILRYVVDKADSDKVNLEKEIEYISHYIELNKERLNEPDKVSFKTDGDFSDKEIAPLLLITFVENCFKHADLSDDRGFISVRLTQTEIMLKLHCKNSVGSKGENLEKGTGAGIKNARRRMELAYPDDFELSINSGNDEYELSLNIF